MPKPPSTESIDDTIDPVSGHAIKDKINKDLQPGSGGGGVRHHNKGQPKRAPYATESSANGTMAKFLTDCAKEHRESLQCIERNYQDRSVCEEYFQAYKQCRKQESEKARSSNISSSSKSNSGWFW